MSNLLSLRLISIIVLSFFSCSVLQSGIPLGTLVSTDKGMVPVECLFAGDAVYGKNVATNAISLTPVKHILFSEQQSLTYLETDQGTFTFTQDQQLYDVNKREFVVASTIKPGTSLALERGVCRCKAISSFVDSRICYELVLDQPNNFFVTNAKLLVHNFTPALSIASGAARAAIGAVIALLYLNRSPEIFRTIEEGARRLAQKVDAFIQEYSRPKRGLTHKKWPSFEIAQRLSNPCIGGVRPERDIYRNILTTPWEFGPMCLTAQVNKDGKIACVLHVLAFDHIEYLEKNRSRPVFRWKEFGRDMLPGTHATVRNFVKQENEKCSKVALELFNRIPQVWRTNFDAFSIHAVNKKVSFSPGCSFYGTQFAAHALYCVVQKRIPVLTVLDVVNYGQSRPARDRACVIFWKRERGVAALVEKRSGTILSVGRYPSDIARLDEKKSDEQEEQEKAKQETDEKIEKILEGAKPGRVTNGPTEQWEKKGGFEEAKKDLEDSGATIIKGKPDILVGVLPDGRKIVARDESLSKKKIPTLEIQVPGKRDRVKIRYGKR